jgi:hypothetical protein
MKVRLLNVLALAVVAPVHAAYNANIDGVVTWVATYTESDAVFFQLSNQPSSHPQCSPQYFVVAETVTEHRRRQAFAQLLAAAESKRVIRIGYDNAGDCASGYIRVHRVG